MATTLVLRSIKGSALTHAEADTNFTNLRDTADAATLTGKTLVDPILTGTPTEDIYTITDGGAVTLDPSNGSTQLWTLGASRTPTLTSITAGEAVRLGIDDGSAYTLTLTGVTWRNNGGVAPVLKTSGYTWILIEKIGSTLYADLLGDQD